jgi:hypothetical protein
MIPDDDFSALLKAEFADVDSFWIWSSNHPHSLALRLPAKGANRNGFTFVV